MKILILILSSIILSSCGQLFDKDVVYKAKPHFGTSNPYFDSYKSDFASDYHALTGKTISTNIPINFTNDYYFPTSPNSIGVCFSSGSRGIEIIVKASYWASMSRACQDQLMYHEMGHCLLNQDHRDSYISIMNSNNSNCDLHRTYENTLIEELMLRTASSIEFLKEL